MKTKNSLKEFLAYIKNEGKSTRKMDFKTGFEMAVAFYKKFECENVAGYEDGDKLLFQWGTYDWGKGKRFELDITRQFYQPETEKADLEIWHLKLEEIIQPNEDTEKIKGGNIWCQTRSDADEFTQKVLNHPALSIAGSFKEHQLKIFLERV
jgi:hypothetical protein